MAQNPGVRPIPAPSSYVCAKCTAPWRHPFWAAIGLGEADCPSPHPTPTSLTTHPGPSRRLPTCDTWGSPAQRSTALPFLLLNPDGLRELAALQTPAPSSSRIPGPEALSQRGGRTGGVCLGPRAQRKSEVGTQRHTHASLFLPGNSHPCAPPSAARS